VIGGSLLCPHRLRSRNTAFQWALLSLRTEPTKRTSSSLHGFVFSAGLRTGFDREKKQTLGFIHGGRELPRERKTRVEKCGVWWRAGYDYDGIQVDRSGSDVMLFAVCGVPFQSCIRHARETLAAWDLPSLRAGGGTRQKPPLVVAAEAQRVRALLLVLRSVRTHTHTHAAPSPPPLCPMVISSVLPRVLSPAKMRVLWRCDAVCDSCSLDPARCWWIRSSFWWSCCTPVRPSSTGHLWSILRRFLPGSVRVSGRASVLLGLPGSAWRYHRLLSAAAPTDLLFGT